MSRHRRRSHQPRSVTGAAPVPSSLTASSAVSASSASATLREPSAPATLQELVDANVALSARGPASGGFQNVAQQMAARQQGASAFWNANGGTKPIPDLPKDKPGRPNLDIYGATGTANFSGIITSDEYNPDLLAPLDRATIYNEMRLSHATVKALLVSLTQPLLRAEWSIQPGGPDDATEYDPDDDTVDAIDTEDDEDVADADGAGDQGQDTSGTSGTSDTGTQQLRERLFGRSATRLTERRQMRRLLRERPRARRFAERAARSRYGRRFSELDDAQARNIEIAAFVQTCLFDDLLYTTTEGHVLRQSWDDVLRHVLLLYAFGYSVFEVCYRIEDGWTKWAKLTPLLPRTIYRWWVGADNELAGIQQWTFRNWSYEFVNLPASKLLLFVREREGSNFEGISVLRAAYKHYMYATTFERIDAIAIERQSLVPPVIGLPTPFTAEDITAANNIVRNIRANEQLGIVIPHDWSFEFPRNQARYSAQALPAIEHHNTQILVSGLMDWLGLGQGRGGTGSYALADVRLKMIEQAIQADAKMIEEVMNTAIRRLVDYNFEDVTDYPTLKCAKISMADATMMGQTLSQLAQFGLIHPSPEMEAALLNMMGLPNAKPSAVESQNPTAERTPEQPENDQTAGQDAEPDQTPANQQQQTQANAGPDAGAALRELRGATVRLADAKHSENHTGIMVALMLPADLAATLAGATEDAVPDDADAEVAPPQEQHITLAYLGDKTDPQWTPDEQQRLRDSVDDYAAQQQPITARLSRLGRFHNDGADADAVHAKVTSRTLHTLRRGLVAHLKADGFPVDETFPDYQPHVTLAYVRPDAPTPPIALPTGPAASVPFTHATVAIGGMHSHHALGTEQPAMIATSEPVAANGHEDGLDDAALAEAVLAAIHGVDVVERAERYTEAFAGAVR